MITVGKRYTDGDFQPCTVIGKGNNEYSWRVRYEDGTVAIINEDELDAINGSFDSDLEDHPQSKMDKLRQYAKKGLVVLSVFVVVGTAYGVNQLKKEEDSKRSELLTLTEELNRLNTEDIPDIGACTRTKVREARKKIIIQSLNSYK